MSKFKKGFTLIELLAVVAIIGLLASIILASLATARKKARDARRLADIREIQLALELYFDAQPSNSYPAVAAPAAPPAALATTYIPVVPVAPGPGSYLYNSRDGAGIACTAAPCVSYILRATIEDGNNSALAGDLDGTIAAVDCTDTAAGYYYCVQP